MHVNRITERCRVPLRIASVGLLLLAWTGLPPLPVARAQSTAVCLVQYTLTFSPGLTTTSGKHRFTTDGETGRINCIGQVNGETVTGPGTYDHKGSIKGTCIQGRSTSATISFTVPTTGGRMHLSFPVTFTYRAGVGFKSSDVLNGPFEIVPTDGDCVLTPITRAAVTLQATVTT